MNKIFKISFKIIYFVKKKYFKNISIKNIFKKFVNKKKNF
jgi:hypothetical protein